MTSKTENTRIPGVLQWTIGRKKVTVINDSFFEANEHYFTHLPHNGAKDILTNALRPVNPTLSINVFLIEADEHEPVLIDAGMGDKFAPAIVGRLTEGLGLIGLKPEDIGIVLLTHLHGDHYQGLIDNSGNKCFPNAKIWVSQTERDYWFSNSNLKEHDLQNAKDAQAAIALYEMLAVNQHEIVPGITTVPLPGHTPGQTGFLLNSDGEQLLFCADILTVPALQATVPEIGFVTDADYNQAVLTRKQTLTQAAAEGMLITGPHFEFPCLSYVKVDGSGFKLIPKQWF